MKIEYVFFGSPEFAAIALERLLEADLIPLAVVTNPDRPFGRKKRLTPPPVKELAKKWNIKVFQPEKLDSEFVAELRALKPQLFVVAAYSKIIPQEVISIPEKGVLGIHPSLLPKYRGASPIQGALLSGDEETGVSIYLIDAKVDHGPVISKAKVRIDQEDDYLSLEKKLASFGGILCAQAIDGYLEGTIFPSEQDHESATFTKKFSTEDAFISFADLEKASKGEAPELAREIFGKIRALSPNPGAWTVFNKKRIKLLKAELRAEAVRIKLAQIEGKNATSNLPWISS